MDARHLSSRSSELLPFVSRIRDIANIGLACAVWQAYDWMINFEHERKLVWRRKISAGSILYVVLRVYSIAFQTFDFFVMVNRWTNKHFCRGFYYQVAVSTTVIISLVHGLLLGRLYALYQCHKRLLWLNLALFALSIGGAAVILSRTLPGAENIMVPEPLVGCWVIVSQHTIFSLLPSVAFEVWLCFLVTRKAVQEAHFTFAWPPGGPLLRQLFRDYAIWFAVVLIGTTGNIFVFLYAPLGYNYTGIAIFHSAMCVGGCRMVLNARTVYYAADEDILEQEGLPRFSVSGMFARPPMVTTNVDMAVGPSEVPSPFTEEGPVRWVPPVIEVVDADQSERGSAFELDEIRRAWRALPDEEEDIVVEIRTEPGPSRRPSLRRNIPTPPALDILIRRDSLTF